MIPQCLDQGVGIVPWSPLARGLLAGTVHPQRRAANHAGPHRALPPLALPARPRPSGDLARCRDRGPAGCLHCPGRAVVASAQAGRDRADRGRDQAGAPRGCTRGRATLLERRGDRAPRGALRAASCVGDRALVASGRRGPPSTGSPASSTKWAGSVRVATAGPAQAAIPHRPARLVTTLPPRTRCDPTTGTSV